MLGRAIAARRSSATRERSTAIGVLVRNLCLEREPLYGLADWAGDLEPRLVGLAPGEAALLNGDRVGRALDELFDADRGSLLTDLVLAAISEFAVDCSQLHDDFDPLPFDASAARAFGQVAASLRRAGRNTAARTYDAMIAATAIGHSMVSGSSSSPSARAAV